MITILYDAYIMQDGILSWSWERDQVSKCGLIEWCRDRHMRMGAQPCGPGLRVITESGRDNPLDHVVETE